MNNSTINVVENSFLRRMKKIIRKMGDSFKYSLTVDPHSYNFELLQEIPIEVAVLDKKGKYLFANKYYINDERIAKGIIGRTDSHYFKLIGLNQEYAKKRREYFEKAINEKETTRFTENIYFPQKNRSMYYTRFYQPNFSDSNKSKIDFIYFFGKDITAIIHAQKELRQLAYSDKLTGLKNREAFYDQLGQLLIDSERRNISPLKAILFCDLDNFKLVNDTYGHDVGDLVLKEAANRMKKCLRKSDFVFRLGGDEFTVIIRNLKDELDAGKVAEKIISKISAPYYFNNKKITSITTSIGIVPFTNERFQCDLLVKKADTAMYIAKKRSKGSFQFISEEMTEKAIRRLKVEQTLRDLINENKFDEQFTLLYQPIVQKQSHSDYKILGAEALIRWNNPHLGLVLPSNFIPISEETNLIREVGNWVLNKSFKDFSSIIKSFNSSFYFSINVSAKQLKNQNMIKNFEDAFKNNDIKPENLQIEITETSFIDYDKNVMDNLHKLRDLGIKLAVDDFGVGFASLSYLQRLPASTIKIDKSFINKIGLNDEANDFIRSIITFGKSIDKEIIAEGVENWEQVAFLSKYNCEKFQGFLFSKPLHLNEFKDLLKGELINIDFEAQLANI
jgi:diguanylate cyclase (GGDEF)-like protein